MVPQAQVKKLPPEIRRQNGKRSAVETAMPPTGSCCSSTSPSGYMMKPSRAISSVNLESVSDVSETVFVSVIRLPYSNSTCIQGVSPRFLQRVLQTSGTSSTLTWQIARGNFTVSLQDSGQECNHSSVMFHFTLLYFTLLYVMLRSL
jgi:hypothetical protein